MKKLNSLLQRGAETRKTIEYDLDTLEFISFSEGFESAIEYIDQEADSYWNVGRMHVAEILRELAKEMRGDE